MNFLDAFSSQTNIIGQLGEENAFTAWAMALYLEDNDVEALAAVALTDGPNDKKIDFIHLDHDAKRLVFAQGFFGKKARDTAPANKASDLNTAAAWLLSGDTSLIPENLKSVFHAARDALDREELDSIELIYVHNVPESVSVARELQTAEDHFKKALNSSAISVKAMELGTGRIQHLYDAQDSHIDVKDELDFPVPFSFTQEGDTWKAYVSSVPGTWLHTIYTKYSDRLFSANYRGFLGGGRRRRVNAGIRESAESKPGDFWAFNNGITLLTMRVAYKKTGGSRLVGISIINGAQTTGSIGSVDISKKPLSDVKVLCRVIECSDPDTIAAIVRYNNTQNAITNWDQYSNDPDQKRIADEFSALNFTYNIKRGYIGSGEQIGIDEVIQPLLAFHGRPQDATRGKSQIFDRKPLYQNAFDGKKARHIIFVYSLSKAIDDRRITLKSKSNNGTIIGIENDQLSLMRSLRFKSFFISLMAHTIETSLGKKCDPQTVAFDHNTSSNKTLVELAALWSPLVDTLLALVTATSEAQQFPAKLSEDGFMTAVAKQVNALLYAMEASSKHSAFAELVTGE